VNSDKRLKTSIGIAGGFLMFFTFPSTKSKLSLVQQMKILKAQNESLTEILEKIKNSVLSDEERLQQNWLEILLFKIKTLSQKT
jgi:hypothetical protein